MLSDADSCVSLVGPVKTIAVYRVSRLSRRSLIVGRRNGTQDLAALPLRGLARCDLVDGSSRLANRRVDITRYPWPPSSYVDRTSIPPSTGSSPTGDAADVQLLARQCGECGLRGRVRRHSLRTTL